MYISPSNTEVQSMKNMMATLEGNDVSKLQGIAEHIIYFITFGLIDYGEKRKGILTGLTDRIEKCTTTNVDGMQNDIFIFSPESEGRRKICVEINKQPFDSKGSVRVSLMGTPLLPLSETVILKKFTGQTDTLEKNIMRLKEKFILERPTDKVLNMEKADLSWMVLPAANLAGMKMHGVIMTDANLFRVKLTEADLLNADLSGAYLSEADMQKTNLSDASLINTELSGAVLSGAVMERANLTGANLAGANLEGAILRGAILKDQDLRNVILTGADLSGADLSGADLRGLDLRTVNLTGANLSGASLRGLNLNGINLQAVNLTDADLTRTQLRGANLSCANLTNAILSMTDLTGARLISANLTRANLFMADLTDARCESAICVNTAFTGAKFHETNLTGADFYDAIMDEVDMRESDFNRNKEALQTIGSFWLRLARYVRNVQSS